MSVNCELLKDFWYVALPSKHLKSGKTCVKTILCNKIIIGRDNQGKVFALRDFCPHRGMPLSYGKFDGREIECCYHGWCFNTNGVCTKIPSLAPDDETDPSKIKATSFPCEEKDGLIWVYIANSNKEIPDVPNMPVRLDSPFYWVESVTMPCDVDNAVMGLMDPSHGPFVHKSWFWRSGKSIHLKQKEFAPTSYGFKMVSHKPSSNSRAYKILGGDRKTEISFQLPGLRTEHVTISKHHIVLLTALTPVDEKNTVLHQFMYTNNPSLNFFRFIFRPFGKKFIQQDVEVVTKQQEGLENNVTPLLLLGDADAQARWYLRLKKEYIAAQHENRPFENKLKAKTLKWRS